MTCGFHNPQQHNKQTEDEGPRELTAETTAGQLTTDVLMEWFHRATTELSRENKHNEQYHRREERERLRVTHFLNFY